MREWAKASVFSFDYCVSHGRLGSSKAFVHGTCIKATNSFQGNKIDGGIQSLKQYGINPENQARAGIESAAAAHGRFTAFRCESNVG
jgi:hypothetical protein